MAASSDDRGNERAGGGDGEAEERTDGWMATYADMVTLLLTFFVLMFALSNVDNEKAQLFLFAMSRGGITAEQFMEIRERYELDELSGGEFDDLFPSPGTQGDLDSDYGDSVAAQALRDLHAQISEYIVDTGIQAEIKIEFDGDFLVLTLSNDVWFDSGSANISEIMKDRASMIGLLLAANFHVADPFEIVVAGHTDSVPINTPEFPSNWHLSSARAQNFLEMLMDDSGLEPFYFMMRACGEYRPVATNATPEGRQANRRVEVMISRARNLPAFDDEHLQEVTDTDTDTGTQEQSQQEDD